MCCKLHQMFFFLPFLTHALLLDIHMCHVSTAILLSHLHPLLFCLFAFGRDCFASPQTICMLYLLSFPQLQSRETTLLRQEEEETPERGGLMSRRRQQQADAPDECDQATNTKRL